ncbi:MAG: insulinase family protein [Candidatus Omnitrophica bacterium]|nr:insulinase family protein [Candidatus Omnitrophota bacterium]
MNPSVSASHRQVYHKTLLDNGLRIVSAPRHDAESVSVGLWIGAGGRYENSRLNGVSHFLEHLLFKGTKNRTSRQIKESIEGAGGSLNAFTDEEYTCVLAKVLPEDLESTVEILTDMVLHASLEEREIEKERQVIMEEIRMYKDLPMQYVHDLLNRLLWPDHPLGMDLTGTERSVGRISRSDLVSYHRRFYTPRNVVIAACGRLSHRALVDTVRRFWDRLAPGTRHVSRRPRQRQSRPRLKIEFKETEQTHFSIGFHAFPRNHPHVYALSLLNVILGGNMSSRLFQKVREDRGLAYEIGSQIKRYRDTGYFSVSAGVEHKHFFQSLQVVLKELMRIRREAVTGKEFEQAKEFLNGQILFALEDTMEHMSWIGECEMTLEEIQPAEKILQQIAQVRRSDLTNVARQVVRRQHLNLALIGPVKKEGYSRIAGTLEES